MREIETGDHFVRRSSAKILKKAAKRVGFKYKVLHCPGQRFFNTLYNRWMIVGKDELHVEVSRPANLDKSWDDFWAIVNPLQDAEDEKQWRKAQ